MHLPLYVLKAGLLKYMINVFQLWEEFSRVCKEPKRTNALLVISKLFNGLQERFFTQTGQGQLLHEASRLVGGRRSPPISDGSRERAIALGRKPSAYEKAPSAGIAPGFCTIAERTPSPR